MEPDPDQASSLLNYLPAVFQADRQGRRPNFVGRFLLAFEKLLLGLGDLGDPGLEEIVSRLYRHFDPDGEPRPAGAGKLPDEQRAPKEFLQWLAGWLALTLRDDWEEQQQRNLIANAVQLYRLRGTRRGVAEFVQIYTQNKAGVRIDEFEGSFQIGKTSTVGVDSLLGGGAPFFFQVHLLLPAADPKELLRQREVAQAILDLQKPAHTYYTLFVDAPRFIIGQASTVGESTLLTD